jgi:hypothetical protein
LSIRDEPRVPVLAPGCVKSVVGHVNLRIPFNLTKDAKRVPTLPGGVAG